MELKRTKYSEGNLFLIETENKNKFIGLIIRRRGRTKLLMGYFWRLTDDFTDSISLAKENPLLITLFSGLGFEIGNWKVLGKYSKWNREEWEIPYFKRIVKYTNQIVYSASKYDDNFKESFERKITKEESELLFQEVVHGYLSLENHLDMMVK